MGDHVSSPAYEVTTDGGEATVVTAGALIDAWGERIPELAAKVLDLQNGMSVKVFNRPEIIVRRIR